LRDGPKQIRFRSMIVKVLDRLANQHCALAAGAVFAQ
jgi:hypothetical protein